MKKVEGIKVVGFDLGETLIEYVDVPLSWKIFYPEIFSKINEAEDLGLSFENIQRICRNLEKYNTRINPRVKEFTAEKIFFDILREFRIEDDVILKKIIPQFFRFFQNRVRPYPETIQVLEELKNAGYKIIIVTDVPYGMPDEFVYEDIKSFAGLVDKVITSVYAGFRKPEPAGIKLAADHFGINSEEIVFVGNEMKDIEVCKNFGCRSIFIDRNNSSIDLGEDFRISSLTELLTIIK